MEPTLPNRLETMSVLFIDNERPILGEARFFAKERRHNFHNVSTAREALNAVGKTMFDFVICDAQLDYHGEQYGGLQLARELEAIVGRNSLIVASRFVSVNQFKESGVESHLLQRSYLDEDDAVSQFLENKVLPYCRLHASRQTAFIAVPFKHEFDDVSTTIDQSMRSHQFEPVRIDETRFNNLILERMLEEIRASHLLVADITGNNPNVAFECGYAKALGKHVILIQSNSSVASFDAAAYQVHKYETHDDIVETLHDSIGQLRKLP